MFRAGVLVTCLVAVCVLASGCYVSAQVGASYGPPEETFRRDGIPISFRYPSALGMSESPEVSSSGSARPDDSVALAADESNAILVQRYTLRARVDQANLPTAKSEIDQVIGGLAGRPQDGALELIAGFPAVTYEPFEVSVPRELVSRVLVLFDGDQEIFINCQSTPGSTGIPTACDQMLATLTRA